MTVYRQTTSRARAFARTATSAAALLLPLAGFVAVSAVPAAAGEKAPKVTDIFETKKNGDPDYDKQRLGTEDAPLLGRLEIRKDDKGKAVGVFLTSASGVRYIVDAVFPMAKALDEGRPEARQATGLVATIGKFVNKPDKGKPVYRMRLAEYYEYVEGTVETTEPEGGKGKPVTTLTDAKCNMTFILLPPEKGGGKAYKQFMEAVAAADGPVKASVYGTAVKKEEKKRKKKDDEEGDGDGASWELVFWRGSVAAGAAPAAAPAKPAN